MNKIIVVNVADIQSNEQNPRLISETKFEQLKESVKYMPEMLRVRPIVCVTDKISGKYTALGGNMRLKALQELQIEKTSIVLVDDWTEEQQKEFIIKDNLSFGTWNFNELREHWDIEELQSWGLDFTIEDAQLEDIDEYGSISGSTNFIIKCSDLAQLEELQQKLQVQGSKISFETFILKTAL